MKIRLWAKWIARIAGITIVVFSFPFYFGYGNPFPFMNPDYTVHDNAWSTAFLFVFFGLVLAWRFPKVGGYMVVSAILAAQTVTFFVGYGLVVPMMLPLLVGALFVVSETGESVMPKKS